jgi:hypothetical protein
MPAGTVRHFPPPITRRNPKMLGTPSHMEGESMPKHVGIVACSAEGVALSYRTLRLLARAALGEALMP